MRRPQGFLVFERIKNEVKIAYNLFLRASVLVKRERKKEENRKEIVFDHRGKIHLFYGSNCCHQSFFFLHCDSHLELNAILLNQSKTGVYNG